MIKKNNYLVSFTFLLSLSHNCLFGMEQQGETPHAKVETTERQRATPAQAKPPYQTFLALLMNAIDIAIPDSVPNVEDITLYEREITNKVCSTFTDQIKRYGRRLGNLPPDSYRDELPRVLLQVGELFRALIKGRVAQKPDTFVHHSLKSDRTLNGLYGLEMHENAQKGDYHGALLKEALQFGVVEGDRIECSLTALICVIFNPEVRIAKCLQPLRSLVELKEEMHVPAAAATGLLCSDE